MKAGGRADGRTGGLVVTVLLLIVCSPARLPAQDSQFGIRGLGTPAKWESARARATGGAFAPFDALSSLSEAPLADVRRIAAGLTSATSWRTVTVSGTESPLKSTRFPAFVISGPIGQRFTVAGGFATYLDRTFGVITYDTIDLRGTPEPITDEVRSDGAVADLRLAVAMRLRPWLALGGAFHLLTGSTRMDAIRRFDDSSTYHNSRARAELAYEGSGGSISALVDLHPRLRVALWGRTDSKLRTDLNGKTTVENDLPVSVGGGLRWVAGSKASIASAVGWRHWKTAGTSVDAHDTFNWSLGAELGSAASPLRLGVRGGQLPFGVGEAPKEFGLSAGLGKTFSGGRGRIDLGVERLAREGGGLTERVWTAVLGLAVRP